ncbi:MAG: hypothetical protein JXR91_03845 [Deltaproteobacteria bacterium]|nr:hypothetical protein [Deltaproteobacteria bacterium]
MKSIKSILNSAMFLSIGSAIGLILSLIIIFPVADFIAHKSVSVVDNFYMTGAFMFLLALSSGVQGFLVIKIIWGDKKGKSKKKRAKDDDDIYLSMRSMKVTGAKKSFVFGILLAVNIFSFDLIGSGVLVTKSYRYNVMSKLRSNDAQLIADASNGAIQLARDEDIAVMLGDIIDKKGPSAEWAAYAAGIRRDKNLTGLLKKMMLEGTPRQRAGAVIALARFEDPDLVKLSVEVWPQMDKYKSDLLIALAMVGKKQNKNGYVFSDRDISLAGDFLVARLESKELTAEETKIAIFALNKFESPEALPYLEALLTPKTDTETLCIAIEALGNIGAADSSPELVSFIEKADKNASCTEMVVKDFAGDQLLICRNSNLIARLLFEIGHIGDYRAVSGIAKVAADKSYSESIRKMAQEFVSQMNRR